MGMVGTCSNGGGWKYVFEVEGGVCVLLKKKKKSRQKYKQGLK